MKLSKKYSVKIPKTVKVIYDQTKDLMILIGPLGKKSFKLPLEILIDNLGEVLFVTKKSTKKFSGYRKASLKSLQGTIAALIKQIFLEVSVTLYKKLNLVGVGYRVFLVENTLPKILHLKLGFSHPIFFKVPSKIKTFCPKSTTLYLSGNSYMNVNQTASKIRSYKIPEPYKGKGILYKNEKIQLKEGKKV